jgi:hypothetical protein
LIEAPETSLGIVIIRVRIWMEACDQSMIGLLDLFKARLPPDAED